MPVAGHQRFTPVFATYRLNQTAADRVARTVRLVGQQ
jgi:hypothetical protein